MLRVYMVYLKTKSKPVQIPVLQYVTIWPILLNPPSVVKIGFMVSVFPISVHSIPLKILILLQSQMHVVLVMTPAIKRVSHYITKLMKPRNVRIVILATPADSLTLEDVTR